MKGLKITLKTVIYFFVFAVIALLFARIFVADYYPAEMKEFVYTEKMQQDEMLDIDKLDVYTQKLMAPYDDPKNGNFFANYMLCAPDVGVIQATVRYNSSTLPRVAEFYEMEAIAGGPLELFDFSLLVSYETEDPNGNYVRYAMSENEAFADEFLMYSYARLVFEDVEFEGAIWMRVDIFLRGQEAAYAEEKRFGSIVLYEAYEVHNGQKIEYPLEPYTLSKKEKRDD